MFAKNRNDFAHVLRGLEFENALPLERQSARTRQGVGRRVGQSKPAPHLSTGIAHRSAAFGSTVRQITMPGVLVA